MSLRRRSLANKLYKTIIDVDAPDYITYGLVFLLDGKMNTVGGHTTNTKKWVDLSGNGQDAVLDGTYEWYDNALHLEQRGGCVLLSALPDMNTPFTVEYVYTYYASSGYGRLISFAGDHYSFQSGPQVGRAYFGGTVFSIDTDDFSTFNATRSYTGTVDTNKACAFYRNGVFKVRGTAANDYQPAITANSAIGRYAATDTSNLNITIDVHSLRLYNRVLSDSEIQTNYEKDKIRYGLS